MDSFAHALEVEDRVAGSSDAMAEAIATADSVRAMQRAHFDYNFGYFGKCNRCGYGVAYWHIGRRCAWGEHGVRCTGTYIEHGYTKRGDHAG